MSRHLRRLGSRISVSIKVDQDGYLGRECPECEMYFKITPGTGIVDGEPKCICPYCGKEDLHDKFYTKAQIEYAKSVALNRITGAVLKDLKSLEFNHKPKGPFGIGFSMKVEGRPEKIRGYAERILEEEVVCDNCTLRYTLFGSFAYCPDCGQHNSYQILNKNLHLAEKMIDLAVEIDIDLGKQLISDALENGVSAFDGFGRETCRVFRTKSTDMSKAERVSFQNLPKARTSLLSLFGFDLIDGMEADDWEFVCRCFQKRHLLAHSMGIVDEAYMRTTNDSSSTVGRKVMITANEVKSLLNKIRTLGSFLTDKLGEI